MQGTNQQFIDIIKYFNRPGEIGYLKQKSSSNRKFDFEFNFSYLGENYCFKKEFMGVGYTPNEEDYKNFKDVFKFK